MKNQVLIEEKRVKIINYIKKNPGTSYREIKMNTRLHPNRYFDGLSEAFKLAKVEPPRLLRKRTRKEREQIIVDYIRTNKNPTQNEIIKNTGVKIQGTFGNIREAYKVAGIAYFREQSCPGWGNSDEKRKKIIGAIKKNPYLTVEELSKELDISSFFHLFKSLDEVYKLAGVKKRTKGEKIRNRKRKDVINYIRKNPFSTQREINRACKTHVQELFHNGIFGAYKEAKIKFPFERLRLYGIGLKEVRGRAKCFEEDIALRLSGYGNVNRLVKTKRGVADIILERKDEKIVIEIKDYQKKDISISQIKQLNKYLEDLGSNIGFLICHKKPKKDKFIIGKNKILILEKQELHNFKDYLRDL